jgi:polysaccharide export outer membrane protein
MTSSRPAAPATALVLLTALSLGACSALPSSGPTGREILRASALPSDPGSANLPFRLVSVQTASEVPQTPVLPTSLLSPAVRQPTNLIGPNDMLSITIFEAGVTLFGGRSTAAAGARATRSTSSGSTVNTEQMPGMRVDDQGLVRVPFVGPVRAAGRTTSELQEAIRRGLLGKSQAPQVIVTIEESITNSLVLAGEVIRPGRLPLTTPSETLVDAVALAGGYRGEAKDLVARVERGGDRFEIRLSDLFDSPQQDVPVGPGDRITLVSRPQSFSVLGAANRAEQIRFPRGRITLAEAVALAGGASPSLGDAGAVFVFRYVPGLSGQLEPVVYHLNMKRPNALFLAQRFAMRDEDLLYIGNAEANQPTKMVQLVSQLFVPVVTARSVLP